MSKKETSETYDIDRRSSVLRVSAIRNGMVVSVKSHDGIAKVPSAQQWAKIAELAQAARARSVPKGAKAAG